MTKEQYKELLEWLMSESERPCDLTFHTNRARADFRLFLEQIVKMFNEKEK